MSLSYDVRTCKNTDEDVESGLTKCIIFASMGVALGSITEDNIEEWLFRLLFKEQLGQSLVPPEYINMDVLRRHIGLKVNVCDEDRERFLLGCMRTAEQGLLYTMRSKHEIEPDYESCDRRYALSRARNPCTLWGYEDCDGEPIHDFTNMHRQAVRQAQDQGHRVVQWEILLAKMTPTSDDFRPQAGLKEGGECPFCKCGTVEIDKDDGSWTCKGECGAVAPL